MSRTITITYFKQRSGKYYSEGSYKSEKETFHECVDELIEKLKSGESPGLQHDSMRRNHFDAIMNGADFPPHMIRVYNVCDCSNCLIMRSALS